MTDLLVKLYELPAPPADDRIRPAIAPERHAVKNWVDEYFSPRWGSEVAAAFSFAPVRCLVAQHQQQLLGFACYNCTFQGFFGPVGVHEKARGHGLGTALTHHALLAMKTAGFAYAVIGATSAPEFYASKFAATPIPNSSPGAYSGILS